MSTNKHLRLLAAVFALAFLVTACGSDAASTDSETPIESGENDGADGGAEELLTIEAAIVDKTLSDAEAWAADNNMIIRVMERDGEQLMGTADFVQNRINVAVTDGKVTAVMNLG